LLILPVVLSGAQFAPIASEKATATAGAAPHEFNFSPTFATYSRDLTLLARAAPAPAANGWVPPSITPVPPRATFLTLRPTLSKPGAVPFPIFPLNAQRERAPDIQRNSDAPPAKPNPAPGK
jgi:hypothetical protein